MRDHVVAALVASTLLLHGCAAEPADERNPTETERAGQGVDDPEDRGVDHYEISNVRIKKEDPLVGDSPTYHVVFDARWLGDGTPPLVTCSYTVFAQDGSKIEKGVTRLAIEEGKGLRSTVLKEDVVPSSAKFQECPRG